MKKISLKSLIAPTFHKTFNSKKPHQIDEGGRASTKTSKNALKIAKTLIQPDIKGSAIVVRKYQNTLRNSVFKEIKRALGRLEMSEGVDYTSSVSPMQIKLFNGNTIYFAGLDSYEKLKGFIDEDRPIKICWFEEITEFTGEDEMSQVSATFARGNDDWFINLYSFNPPKNKFEWVNEWAEKMGERDDCLLTKSDYRTVPKEWLGKMFIEEAERLEKYDNKRYRWMYLGEVIGIEGLIFNYDLVLKREADYIEKNNLRCLYIDFAMDVGYSTSATTCGCFGYFSDGNWYLLDNYYYSPNEKTTKKAPSEFSKDIYEFRTRMMLKYRAMVDKETCDSAETALVLQLDKDYGIRVHKVNKGTNKEEQIEFAQDFLAKGKFFVLDTPNNAIFFKEMKNYKWVKDSVEKGKPIPDKTEMTLSEAYYNSNSNDNSYSYCDHLVDAWIYWVLDNKEKLGLKF